MVVGKDQIKWMLTANRLFSVRSLYLSLVKTDCGFPQKFLLKVKVLSKIKIFMWLMARKSILTRDNLLRRGWRGNKNGVYCG